MINIWLLLGKSDIKRVREDEKEDPKNEKKKKTTWRLHLGRPSQTNEAIKKCETSAVQSARQCNVVHKHNVGRRVVEEEEE